MPEQSAAQDRRQALALLTLDVQEVLDEAKSVHHHLIFHPFSDPATEEDARWMMRYDAVVAKLKEIERVLWASERSSCRARA